MGIQVFRKAAFVASLIGLKFRCIREAALEVDLQGRSPHQWWVKVQKTTGHLKGGVRLRQERSQLVACPTSNTEVLSSQSGSEQGALLLRSSCHEYCP